MPRILAIDPGGVSGIAEFDGQQFTCGEIEGGYAPLLDYAWVRLQSIDMLVIERFNINAGTHEKAREFDAVYAVGGILWMGHYAEIPVVLQQPAVGKGKMFATHDKLRTLGMYTPSKGGHQVDATCHLLESVRTLPYYSYLLERLV